MGFDVTIYANGKMGNSKVNDKPNGQLVLKSFKLFRYQLSTEATTENWYINLPYLDYSDVFLIVKYFNV